MEDRTLYEIIKEYSLYINELGYSVSARIIKNLRPINQESSFEWNISHYCKPSEGAVGVYIPSVQSGDTFEEAEDLLFAYLNAFTTIGVRPNENY